LCLLRCGGRGPLSRADSSLLRDLLRQLLELVDVDCELGRTAETGQRLEPLLEGAGALCDELVQAGGQTLSADACHATHGLVAEERLQQLLSDHRRGRAGPDLQAGGDEGGG